jgi:hypothetical protein
MPHPSSIITVGEITIEFDEPDAITNVVIRGHRLKDYLQPFINQIRIDFDPIRPHKNVVMLPDELKTFLQTMCNTVSELKKSNRHCLAAHLATTCFQELTYFPNRFLESCQYVLARGFWLEIVSQVSQWESLHDVKVHKGHPYFFLAFSSLLSGDLEAGFVYAYNAIKDDEVLGELCPHLHYPQEAPIYVTALMLDHKANTMYDLVMELRRELERHIASYRAEFNRVFTIQDFDLKFLRSSELKLKSLRYLFVFCFWSLVELRRKTDPETLRNDFSKLRNLNLTFSLCLLIDKLLEANPRIGKDTMAANVIQVCNDQGWLSRAELAQLEKAYGIDISQGDPDDVLEILLPMNVAVGPRLAAKEAIHYLVAWNLRNYGGHRIAEQKSLVDDFDTILQVLIRCIILSVDLL